MNRILPLRLERWGLPLLAAALLTGCLDTSTAASESAGAAAPAAGASDAQAATVVAIARGKIEVPGGLLALSPALDGLVQDVPVQEGQDVTRGQLLLRLQDGAAAADVAVAQSRLQLAQARHQSQAQRLPGLKQTEARLAKAAAAGAAEPQRAEDARQARQAAESDLSIAKAEVDVARAQLAQAKAHLAQLSVHAPEDGTIVRIHAQPGERLPAQAAAAITLLPRRALIVRAELNERYADQIRIGQQASVVTDGDSLAAALPAARVIRISPVLGTGRLDDDSQRGPVRIIECILAFDQPIGLRVGQNVRISFHE